jgi:hypothetical protein
VVGGGTLAVGALWILIAITRGIAVVFSWSLAAVYAGVGIVLGLVGLVAAAVFWNRVRELRVLPKTRQTLREHAAWVRRRGGETA